MKNCEVCAGYARQNQLEVIPSCKFVRAYLKRHPDEAIIEGKGSSASYAVSIADVR